MTTINIKLQNIIGRRVMADIAFERDLLSTTNVYSQGDSIILNSPIVVYTDYMGETKIDLEAGVYFVRILDAQLKATVPVSTTPVDLSAIIFEEQPVEVGVTYRITDELGNYIKINTTDYLAYR